jgi:UbiD family decarboxylase
MINSLRDFIDECEKIGELARIGVEVDWNLELSHIADPSDQKGGPALIFENVKGSKHSAENCPLRPCHGECHRVKRH